MPAKVFSLLNALPEPVYAAGEALPVADPLPEGGEAEVVVAVAAGLELGPVDDGSFVP